MKKTIESAKINGMEVQGDYLFKKADELTKIAAQLRLATGFLGNIYQQSLAGDEFTLSYFIKSGQFDTTLDVLSNISEEIQEVSNNICPD